MSKIEIRNVYKIFGDNPSKVLPMVQDGASKEEVLEKTGHTVGLDNVSLSIEEGETFVCMGLSGSGKSTLIRHINRLIDPTSGEVLVEGTNVMDLDQKNLIEFRRHKMSMVFQRFGLFPHKTVIENVGYGLEVQGKTLEERNKIAMEKIESVGLNGFEHQYPNQLSGGMQQRVGLARALAADPEFLLMDEPFSALDPLIRRQLQSEFIKLSKQMKKTTVFITHDLDEAVRVGHRIAIMRDGKVIQVGTPEEIVVSPADDYVADFVKGISRLKVVQAKSIMQSLESYENKNGKLSNGLEVVDEHDLLSKLIETSASKDKPILVNNSENKTIGVISQSGLLKAVIEGGDGE